MINQFSLEKQNMCAVKSTDDKKHSIKMALFSLLITENTSGTFGYMF